MRRLARILARSGGNIALSREVPPNMPSLENQSPVTPDRGFESRPLR